MNRFFSFPKSDICSVMSKWFYAVNKGRVPGVYSTWGECENQVKGFFNPTYKKFSSYDEALQFVSGHSDIKADHLPLSSPGPTIIKKVNNHSSSVEPPLIANGCCHCNASNSVANLASLGSTMQKILGEIEVIKRDLSDIKCSVTKIDGTFFQVPGSKRSFCTSSRRLADGGGQIKRPKFNTEAEYFTGKKFDPAEGVHVHTDGGCFDNGQNGARAGIGVFWKENDPDNISERLRGRPTNNRAEIQAAICAVKGAKKKGITNLILHTDSQFLINGITRWIRGWKRNQWIKTTGSPVINKEDFEELDRELSGINVKWVYVRGHKGDPANEAADSLAKQGAEKSL